MPPITSRERLDSRQVLAANLMFERARTALSQAALADAAGLSRQTISEIERGSANPTLDILDRLGYALGITIDRLFLPHFAGPLDDGELARRRTEDAVDAFDALNAIEDAAGRPRRFSNAGRPRLGR